MSVEKKATNNKVTIGGRSIYWPTVAPVRRLVDMYFEVFHDNNHRFDSCGTPLCRNDVVIDVGCCEGFFATLALEQGAFKVFCFEPGRTIGACLKETFCKEIDAARIEIIPMLLGDTNLDFNFHEDHEDPTISHLLPLAADAKSESVYQVPMTTLDLFCADRRLDRLDYIKIDVEGAEPEVIAGARNAIKRFGPRLAIAVYHAPHHARQLRELISGFNHDYRFQLEGLADFDGVVRPVMLHCHVPLQI